LREKTRQHLDMAKTNAEFLLDLLNDILDFSKLRQENLFWKLLIFPFAALFRIALP